MSKDLKDIDLKSLPEQSLQFVKRMARYRVLLFVLLVAAVYGFTTYKIYTLSNPSTDSSSVDSQVTSLTPHIDPGVITQLENLHDNSVNVRSLFDQARQNPFAE